MKGPMIDALFSGLIALGLALPRTFLSIRLIPIFFTQTLPFTPRVAIAIAMSLPAAVLIYYQLDQRMLAPIELLWFIAKESMLGFIIGLLVSMPFWILQSVGVIIDVQRGNSMFPNSPGSDPDSLPTGEFIRRFGVIIFLQMGVLGNILSNLMHSYVIWPVMNPIPPLDAIRMELIIQRFNNMVLSSIIYASPIVGVLMLIEFGFGLLSIYASQIQVTSTTPAIKSLAALFILMAGTHTLVYVMGNEFNAIKDVMSIIMHKPKI
jgi:type III secretion protein T